MAQAKPSVAHTRQIKKFIYQPTHIHTYEWNIIATYKADDNGDSESEKQAKGDKENLTN